MTQGPAVARPGLAHNTHAAQTRICVPRCRFPRCAWSVCSGERVMQTSPPMQLSRFAPSSYRPVPTPSLSPPPHPLTSTRHPAPTLSPPLAGAGPPSAPWRRPPCARPCDEGEVGRDAAGSRLVSLAGCTDFATFTLVPPGRSAIQSTTALSMHIRATASPLTIQPRTTHTYTRIRTPFPSDSGSELVGPWK